MISYLCGHLASSAASLPFHSKWRKIKVCGAYNKITSIFFDNFPCTLAKMVLLITTFSFSYARWICPAELVYSNLVTVDSTVLCPFHLLRVWEFSTYKREKIKWLRCEVIDILIGLVWWAFHNVYICQVIKLYI